jgi:hypothetical protein
MKRRCFYLFAWVLAFGAGLDSVPAHAATPSFTISATNVTMPSSGNGSIPFVLTSVDGYVGTVAVQCPEVNAPARARIPDCGGGPLFAFDLTANETVDGNLILTPYGVPVPLAVGALLVGLALRRRRTVGWPTLALAVAGTPASLGGVIGCGTGNSSMTPGTYTYTYTITATDAKTNVVVSTTANVTVR